MRRATCLPGADRHDGLWAGMKGCALSGQAIYDAITQRTRAAFGYAVIRICFETARQPPSPSWHRERIGVARDLLVMPRS